jgi:alpha-glucosidase
MAQNPFPHFFLQKSFVSLLQYALVWGFKKESLRKFQFIHPNFLFKINQRVLIVEATYTNVNEIMPYYSFNKKLTANFPFNFQFNSIQKPTEFKPINLRNLITDFEKKKLNEKCWSNWQIGNHDSSRAASRFGIENVDLANALNLLLGGTAVVYNGEEMGMEDLPKNLLKFEDSRDEFGKRYGLDYLNYSRDYYRTPMQWNSLKNAGFTKNENPWLPINPNYSYLNVEVIHYFIKFILLCF